MGGTLRGGKKEEDIPESGREEKEKNGRSGGEEFASLRAPK